MRHFSSHGFLQDRDAGIVIPTPRKLERCLPFVRQGVMSCSSPQKCPHDSGVTFGGSRMERRPKDFALSINIRGNSIGVGPRLQQCPDAFQPAFRCRGEQRGPPDLSRALDHHLKHLGVRTPFQQELDDAEVLPGYRDMKCCGRYFALALHSVRTDTWLRPRVKEYSHDLKVRFVHSRVQGGRDDMTVSVFRGDNGVGVGPGTKLIPHDCGITLLDGGMQRYVKIRLKQLPKRILFIPAHDVIGDSTSTERGSSSGQFALFHSNREWNGSIPVPISVVRPDRTQESARSATSRTTGQP